MTKTPRAIRPHIALVGKRNAGKSSLLNNLTGQEMAIVSPVAGTTTDPVFKSSEFLPFGPVVFVDTAGLDDTGDLGAQRVQRSRSVSRGADLHLYVARASRFDRRDLDLLGEIKKSAMLVLTCAERDGPEALEAGLREEIQRSGIPCHHVSNTTGHGIEELKEALVQRLQRIQKGETSLLQNMIRQFQLIMLIVPIDLEAPKGRLILPQVQAIREILDGDSAALVVKDREVDWALQQLKSPPDLAITDSQVVLKAAGSVPPTIPLTTFSILFSRWKGDLATFVRNVRRIDSLKTGDRVLIAETCTHKAHCDDIARVKIPRWLRQYTGRTLEIDVVGGTFPRDIDEYKLVIHCGGCMITRQMMQARMGATVEREIPITNYGVAISYLQGVLDRVIEPFAAELV